MWRASDTYTIPYCDITNQAQAAGFILKMKSEWANLIWIAHCTYCLKYHIRSTATCSIIHYSKSFHLCCELADNLHSVVTSFRLVDNWQLGLYLQNPSHGLMTKYMFIVFCHVRAANGW